MKTYTKTVVTEEPRLVIERDEYPQSPDKWEDKGLFLIADHRDFYVKREGFMIPDFEECKKEHGKEYYIFPLEAYIHSGVVLALSNEGKFPDRQWDVSQLGYVFVSKKEAKTREDARKLALGLIKEWNTYLEGDVWQFVAYDKKGEVVESLSGIYGLENVKAELPKEWQGVDVEEYIKN